MLTSIPYESAFMLMSIPYESALFYINLRCVEQAIRQVVEETGCRRNVVYPLALKISVALGEKKVVSSTIE